MTKVKSKRLFASAHSFSSLAYYSNFILHFLSFLPPLLHTPKYSLAASPYLRTMARTSFSGLPTNFFCMARGKPNQIKRADHLKLLTEANAVPFCVGKSVAVWSKPNRTAIPMLMPCRCQCQAQAVAIQWQFQCGGINGQVDMQECP